MAEVLAAVVTGFNQPLRVQRVPIPELEPTGMLARVEAATLCGSDVHWWHGAQPGAASPPYIPGHETAGSIVEMRGERWDLLGQPLKVGDRVLCAYRFCGHCYYCTVAKQPTLCAESIRFGRARCDRPPYLLGGCAEYHYFPPGCEIIRVPEEVSSPLAASAACALRTVMHGFERLGPLASHESVLVQGCGPVGLYALAVARDRGARQALVIGAPEGRLEVARAWGADATLNLGAYPDPAARREWALEQTGGHGPDVVIQCATGSAIPEGLEMLRRGGRYLSIGGGGRDVSVPTATLGKHIQFISVRAAEGRHFYQALQFLATRREFPFDRLLSGVYTLDRVTDALQAMAEFREVKAVILPRGAKGA
jgi:threonine dehydrogenase-like Zn-dependent dehydrogenase